jgi:hypothetical protein
MIIKYNNMSTFNKNHRGLPPVSAGRMQFITRYNNPSLNIPYELGDIVPMSDGFWKVTRTGNPLTINKCFEGEISLETIRLLSETYGKTEHGKFSRFNGAQVYNILKPKPSKYATRFKEGTKKEGNDGRMYTVVKTNGVKRWKGPGHGKIGARFKFGSRKTGINKKSPYGRVKKSKRSI